MEAHLEIRWPDGRIEYRPLQGENITLGSAIQAGIHVDAVGLLSPEHVMLAPRKDVCWVAAARGASSVMVSGAAIDKSPVQWGSEFVIGEFTFTPKQGPMPLQPSLGSDSGKGTVKFSPVTLIAVLLLVPLSLWLLFFKEPPEFAVDGVGDREAPALFPESVPCEFQPNVREHQAYQHELDGLTMAERYPFEPSDGVRAVSHLLLADACYRSLERAEDVARVSEQLQSLRTQVDRDYQTYQLRLSLSLEEKRYSDALRVAVLLKSLLTDTPADHPYTERMTNIVRRLEARQARNSKKKRKGL